jgi:hypothetical protein
MKSASVIRWTVNDEIAADAVGTIGVKRREQEVQDGTIRSFGE